MDEDTVPALSPYALRRRKVVDVVLEGYLPQFVGECESRRVGDLPIRGRSLDQCSRESVRLGKHA